MKKILLTLLFIIFCTCINAQCTVSATTNASVIKCGGTAPISSCNGIVYIGNGTNAMSLNINADLDLTCLGAIQFIVRNNATLDFDAGNNKNLQLGAGSSIVFESGSSIKSNNNCSASDLITIGGSSIASCNGGSALLSFPQIVSQGGYSPINASANPSSICTSGSSTITATATPSAGAIYRWYTVASGGSPVQSGSGNTFSTGTISSTTTYYVEAYYASASPTYTTVRKAVTVTVSPTPRGEVYYYTGNPICFNSMTANLTTNNVVGTILGWEKKLDSGSYTPIPNTAGLTTFSENLSTAGIWTYRLVLGNGACSTVYSSNTASVTVVPQLTISLVSNNSSGCQNNFTSTLSYTATTGNASGVKIDFDSTANNAGVQDLDQRVTSGGGGGTLNIQYTWGTAPGVYNGVLTVVSDNPSCTSSTTYPVTLTINPQGSTPIINTQPVAPLAVCSGTGTQTISVGATGTGLTYQWRRNGSVITNGGVVSGATTSTLTLTNPTTANAGTYDVIVTGTCSSGVTSNQVTVTVNANASIASVTGAASICIGGAATTYTANSVVLGGGTGSWSSSNTAVATVNASGNVTGVSAGTTNIIYTITGGCSGTKSALMSITVNANASIASVTGSASICIGGTATTYTANSVVLGGGTGSWSSSNTAVATVDASGNVTGVSAGTSNIIYTITGGCSGTKSALMSITVNANASIASVTGSASICIGGTATTYTANSVVLGGGTGSWSSSNTAVATVNASGNVTGISAGTSNIIYTITGGCSGTKSALMSITVNANASISSVTGSASICIGGTATTYTANSVVLGGGTGSWSSSNTAVATVNASGNVTGVSAGTTNIIYTITGGCSGTKSALISITVNANASIASVTGSASICIGGTATTYTANSVVLGGGTGSWSSSNTAVATVNASGNVTGVSAGTTNIIYTITGGCSGTKSALMSITVNANASIASVTGSASICIGGTATTYTANSVVLGGGTGSWSSSNTAVATVDASGNVTGISAGTSNIIYTITGGCSGTKSALMSITVNANASIASVTGSASICIGGTATTYTANSVVLGGGTGSWSSSNTAVATVDASGNVTGVSAGTSNIIYTITGGCSGTKSALMSITVNANLTASVSILASPLGAICAGTSLTFTATPTNGGITPAYQWKVNGTNAGTNSSTFTTTTLANNDVVTVVMISNASPCLIGSPATSNALTITVNPRPTPTFTTPAQAQTCADEHITYTTEAGYSNYVWTVSGVLNTDYSLIARGTSTNNDIVIEWLTGGPKTVTVNYNNSNGCNASSPAIYTTQVLVTDRGRVNGGTHICKGATLPTLTLQNYAGNTIYPDSSLVLIWQYSDDFNNANWNDIPGTAGQTSYTPTAFPGAYRTYQVILKNGNCSKVSIESRINIDTVSSPTLGTITSLSCSVSTGSVVLNNLPSGNWTINQTGTVTTTYTNTVANTTSYLVTGLAAGTYAFTVKDGNCTSDPSLSLNIEAGNTWDGAKWSKTGNTTLPTAGDKIIFEGDYTLTSDLTACSCTVNSGSVVIKTGITLNITNAVTVNGGTLTFENNASLLQDVNTTVNNNFGPINYKRNSQPMKNFDYTYWSSPVEGQTFYNLSPNTLWDKYLSFTGAVWQEELGTSVMKPGIGYIIRVPKPNSVYLNGKDYWTGSSYIQQVEFIGKPNNGNITSSQYMDKGKYYLVGNPYPSAIHADDFLYSNVNNRDILGGTVYFWTHNTAIKVINSKLAYVSDDYASYNLTGGTATRAALSPGANTDIPVGYIAAGQSFFTSAEDGSGYVQFTNAMRYGGTNNAQFFKPGKTSKSAVLEKHRLWLNMTNSGGAYKQTLIGYIEGATNTYDKNFDGLSFDGNSYVDFYSVNATTNLTIQGRALPFTDTDMVPLGYRSTIGGDFTISIDKADGNLSSQRVYLEDKQTGTINELTAGNYVFTTKAGTFNNRFVLRYSNKTLGTGDFETTEDAVSVVIQNKTVTINSTIENIDKMFIYDLSGKQLFTKDNVKNLQLVIQNLPFAQQVLLVKVVLENGYQTTKKVIFK